MITKELAESLILNIDKIYQNMNKVFNISYEELAKIISHIIYIDKDDFYKNIIKYDSLMCFAEKNLKSNHFFRQWRFVADNICFCIFKLFSPKRRL